MPGGAEFQVDAVAERGGRLLVVEAKSYPRAPAYEGDWKVIHNRAGEVEGDLRTHLKRCEKLKAYIAATPTLSGRWQAIVPIVCTPGPLFVSDSDALAKPELGLRAICSFEELGDALQGDAT